jgi:predicted  nucleic acid-binding Zn ribbon protein
MNPMASQYSFPCPDCGTDWPCPEYIFTTYPGRKVTRWCETCRRLFDVEIPLVPPSEAQS